MKPHDPETSQWQELRETWSTQPARTAIDPSTLQALQRRVRRYRLMWWVENAVALSGILLASMLAWQGRMTSVFGFVVAVLLIAASALACWTALSRRAAWKLGDQSTEGMLLTSMGTTRASIRFWHVNRALTWLAGLAFCVLVVAQMSWQPLRVPAAMVYSPLLIVLLCVVSDLLMRRRLRQLASRLERLQGMVADLHT